MEIRLPSFCTDLFALTELPFQRLLWAKALHISYSEDKTRLSASVGVIIMYKFLHYTVKDAMTPSPVTISPSTPLREVEKIFEEHDFNGVPVTAEDGHLIGMMTKFDLLKACIFTPDAPVPHYDQLMEQPAESVMTTNPMTVTPDLPLSRLLQQLVTKQIKSFPVVENGLLVGIISREDVLKALHRATSQSSSV